MERSTPPANTQTSSPINPHEGQCQVCGMEDICGSLGVIKYDVPPEHPRFGKFYRCPNNPVEVDDAWQEILRRWSNLEALADKTFANFETDLMTRGYSERQINALILARNAALQFAEEPHGWLLMEGSYGTGKTHLAAAVGNVQIRRGRTVVFVTAPDLLDHLRGAYSSDDELGYDVTFDRMRNVDMLILDDLGVENPSPWAQEKLFQLLNHRYTHKLPTVITTNADIDELDPRLRSRLLDEKFTRHIALYVPDYRTAKRSGAMPQLWDISPYQSMTFETFDISAPFPQEERNLRTALEVAWRYAEKPNGWILFTGKPGTGKTHLAAAIAQHIQHTQSSSEPDQIVFLSLSELLTFNRQASQDFDLKLSIARSTPYLVLDSLYNPTSSWAKEILFSLVDYRYVRRLPTILTTTHHIEDIDERIRVRLIDTRLCQIIAITARPYVERIRQQ